MSTEFYSLAHNTGQCLGVQILQFKVICLQFPGQIHGQFQADEAVFRIDDNREFDTLKFKKVPQILEIGLFFVNFFVFIHAILCYL